MLAYALTRVKMAAFEFSLPKQWEDWCSWLLGIWLCISPWALRYDWDQTATRTAVISGLSIVGAELVTLSVFRSWEESLNVILGAWLPICSWILGIGASQARVNFVVIGVVMVALALYEIWIGVANGEVIAVSFMGDLWLKTIGPPMSAIKHKADIASALHMSAIEGSDIASTPWNVRHNPRRHCVPLYRTSVQFDFDRVNCRSTRMTVFCVPPFWPGSAHVAKPGLIRRLARFRPTGEYRASAPEQDPAKGSVTNRTFRFRSRNAQLLALAILKIGFGGFCDFT